MAATEFITLRITDHDTGASHRVHLALPENSAKRGRSLTALCHSVGAHTVSGRAARALGLPVPYGEDWHPAPVHYRPQSRQSMLLASLANFSNDLAIASSTAENFSGPIIYGHQIDVEGRRRRGDKSARRTRTKLSAPRRERRT